MSPADPTPKPVPVALPAEVPGEPIVRLVRLRSEFAAHYPGLDAGAWYPAATVTAYYRAWLVRHPDRTSVGGPLRGLDTEHFDFRGGVPREEPWIPGRSADERNS